MKKISRKLILVLSLISVLFLMIPTEMEAQCPMCRMSAESNLENGGSAGRGLNNGILYMLAMPYFIVGAIGYIWWKNRRKGEDEDEFMPETPQ